MAIVAVVRTWDITVFKKNESIVEKTEKITIEQKATVRKLFREVRKKFKATTAIRLFHITISTDPVTRRQIEVETEITKSDDQINARHIGMDNGARLRVQIHPSNPEVFTIFVTLPSGVNKTFLLEEKENTQKLYQTVRQQLNDDQKIFKLKHGDVEIIPESTADILYSTIFDGVQLKVYVNPKKWSLNIMLPQRNAMINVPEDATVLDLFRKVEEMLPDNPDLRLGIADKQLCKNEDGQVLLSEYAKHTSQVVVLLRAKGGSQDQDPQVQILPSEVTSEVSTSSKELHCYVSRNDCVGMLHVS